MKLLLVSLLSAISTICGAERILGLVIMPSRSHDILLGRLMKELAKRGHHVTYVSPFPEKKTIANFTHVSIEELMKNLNAIDLYSRRQNSPLTDVLFLSSLALEVSKSAFATPSFQKLIHSEEKFDLILTEAFLTEGIFSGFSWKHQAPVVAVGTFMPAFWVHYMVSNPAPYTYIPDPFLAYPTKMTFCQRFSNAIFGVITNLNHRLYTIPKQDELMRKHFGKDLPPLSDIVRNVSLVLVNHHYSLAYPRPYLPNMIEVGGIHVDPPKPLPSDLQKYMDNSKDGVILFSLGTNLKSSLMPKEKLDVLLHAFSRLKQNVMWKFDLDKLPNKPKNVKISKWLPQSDILAHPNLKVFITHGGLLSTTEAVHRAVPIIGIPIFGDQHLNVKETVNAGTGIKLEFDELTSDLIVEAVNEVINNPKYRENVQYRSKLLKDTPLSALDRAIYWIEYVIRHKGAPHLKSKAQNLEWYQLYLADVAVALIIAAASLVTILVLVLKTILKLGLRACKSKKSISEKKLN